MLKRTLPTTFPTESEGTELFPFKVIVSRPPPLTINLPIISTLSKNISPSPTPSPIIRSPSITRSFNVTPETFTITEPKFVSVYVPASVMYSLSNESIKTAKSLRLILLVGLRFEPSPFIKLALTIPATLGKAQLAI